MNEEETELKTNVEILISQFVTLIQSLFASIFSDKLLEEKLFTTFQYIRGIIHIF